MNRLYIFKLINYQNNKSFFIALLPTLEYFQWRGISAKVSPLTLGKIPSLALVVSFLNVNHIKYFC